MATLTRRGFLGWSGVTGYGAWALLRPAAKPPKPPKPTTTTVAATTTTAPTGGTYPNTYRNTY